MSGILFTGGEGPERERLKPFLEDDAFVVAADSGLDLAEACGVRPDLIVGDMDSLRSPERLEAYPNDRVLRFPRDKDETDTEIGLRLLAERGIRRIVLVGGGGGRLAHLLGIARLFEREFRPAIWLTARERVEAFEQRLQVQGCRGRTVSFFPLGQGAQVEASIGLKWPLDGLCWTPADAGISNVAVSDEICVTLSAGRLLMVLEWD